MPQMVYNGTMSFTTSRSPPSLEIEREIKKERCGPHVYSARYMLG